jgi:hypothetical protein
MNPALYRAKQVEPGRAALGARVERDPSALFVHRLVVQRTGSSKTSLGTDPIEDVPRLMAPRPSEAARVLGGACAASPLAHSFSKKCGGEPVVPNPIWVH